MNESALPLPDAHQSWVAGWYWRTDAHGRLQVFRPGWVQGATQTLDDVRLNWQALADHVALQPSWLALWDIAQHQSPGWQHMAYLMSQGVGWSQGLQLPWPQAMPGWWPARETAREPATVWVSASPLRDEAGQCVGFQGICQPQLPAPVAVAQAAAQASEPAMTPAEQEALRYALSHDLRAPLRVVDGFVRIVKEDCAQALGKLGHDHLDRVLAASARMNGMIDAILNQAQLGTTPLQRQWVDISAVAQDICADLGGATAAAGGVAVQFDIEPGLGTEADPQLLRRVLDNLLGNAVKYSAKVAQPQVSLGRMPSTYPEVYFVRDNGAGFDMQHADKLFGMFQRLHSAKEFPGTGVGLAGVQQIVRRHGGRIWAEARPGEGACFYFTLVDVATAQQKLV